MEIVKLTKENWHTLLHRSEVDVTSVIQRVKEILELVKREGDRAIFKLERELDGSHLKSLRVSDEEIVKAYEEVGSGKVRALRKIAAIIERFHKKVMPKEVEIKITEGARVRLLVRPLKRVGVYVPGGKAVYPSTVFMAGIPAKVAGVEELIVCTPPRDGKANPYVLVAADLIGVDEVYKIGGAQAIAAMAYGTKTIKKVEKIVGPGNIYVQAAKRLVSSEVEIDFEAGPSEVMIIADKSAIPEIVALELMAQAEHDVNAASVLVTDNKELALKVKKIIEGRADSEVLKTSLSRYGKIILVDRIERAIDFANDYAPEHLVLMTRNPRRLVREIRNAGEIFVGKYSAVAAGDFCVGPSHVLPTGGKAKVRSGLSVYDFLKFIPCQHLSKKGLMKLSRLIEEMSRIEGLVWHGRSVSERV